MAEIMKMMGHIQADDGAGGRAETAVPIGDGAADLHGDRNAKALRARADRDR